MIKVRKHSQKRLFYHCKVCQSSNRFDRTNEHWKDCTFHSGTYNKDHFVLCNDVENCLRCGILEPKGKFVLIGVIVIIVFVVINHLLTVELDRTKSKAWRA